ncbi:MAG: hypothetical protein J6Y02_22120 [Pseudobutyrivibrio sp.]|nr:hypothetical protein [Pseudobutyrivibrio sp.]
MLVATRKTRASLDSSTRRESPAKTLESREDQLIALATDLVEKRLIEGTASSAETVHFLKLGSSKERQEREKMREEIKLLRAKTDELTASKDVKKLYSEAIEAFGLYSGKVDPNEEDDYEDY